MYATPVVDGNTVVPVVSPPGSMTQRARFGRSPRPSSSPRTCTALIGSILSTNLKEASGPAIRRGRSSSLSANSLLDRNRDSHAQRQVGRAEALVGPLGRIGERHLVRLVRLRQEGPGQIVDGVLHAGVECC